MAAKKKPSAAPQAIPLEKSMAGVLALLVAQREELLASGADVKKTELVLASASLQPSEIAPFLGKNADAVRKMIERGRGK